jgi:hypothetical protein
VWLLELVQAATGKRASSVYAGDPFGDGPGLLVKTHLLDPENWDRAVHLVRHPLDAIEAYYAWRLLRKPELAWPEHLERALYGPRGWIAHTRAWSEAGIPVLRVLYEDLHRDAGREVVRVLDWLGEPHDRGRIVRAVERCRFDRLKERRPGLLRWGRVGRGRARFNPEQLQLTLSECAPFLPWWGP